MIKLVRFLILIAMAVVVIGAIWSILTPTATTDIDVAALAKDAARARVTWADYGEGIKAKLGATPAALWHGGPESAKLVDGGIEVTFSLNGSWSEFDFGMPILLRDPEGQVYAPKSYTRAAPGGTYLFAHNGTVTPLSIPWVEVKFPPNDERRIVFDADGAWHATTH